MDRMGPRSRMCMCMSKSRSGRDWRCGWRKRDKAGEGEVGDVVGEREMKQKRERLEMWLEKVLYCIVKRGKAGAGEVGDVVGERETRICFEKLGIKFNVLNASAGVLPT